MDFLGGCYFSFDKTMCEQTILTSALGTEVEN